MHKIRRWHEKCCNVIEKYRFFLVFAAVLAVVRLWSLRNAPIYAIEHSMHDDRMMVDIAHSIGRGGPDYSQYTLVKGWMYPLYLTVLHLFRIPYIQSIHVMNALLSVLAIYAFNEKKVHPLHYVLYAALVFNPVFASVQVMMRVYRNAFSALMAFAVIISMIALYRRRMGRKRSWILWILLSGIALPAFWYTREDSIWIMPFLAGVILVSVISAGIKSRRRAAALLVCMLIPIVSLEATTHLIRLHRQLKYGQPIVNELSDGAFPRVMKAIYSVELESEEPLYVDASREKIRLLYNYSETLKALEPYLEDRMDEWSQYGRLPENWDNKEVENGWFFWCLRDAVDKSGGFRSLSESQRVFSQIADELEAAIAAGKLKTRMVMPSALMPPWKASTGERLLDALWRIPAFVVSFNMDVNAVISWGNPGIIGRFEDITGNTAIHSTEDPYYASALKCAQTQQKILAVYQHIWPVISWVGRISALLSVGVLLCTGLKKQTADNENETGRNDLLEYVWMLVGIFGALLVLYGGVAYNHAESCHSITELYLSASYPLIILFDMLAIYTAWNCWKKPRK